MTARRWRVGLLLARREVRRHPWRHLLVVALVFIPVLAVFATFSGLDTWRAMEQRKADFRLAGAAGGIGSFVDTAGGGVWHAWAEPPIGTPTGSQPIGTPSTPAPANDAETPPGLPEASVVETYWRGGDWFVLDAPHPSGDGPALAGAEVLDIAHGTRRAVRVVVQGGRLPSTAGEVLISPPLADAGGWGIGSEVRTARTDARLTVVGIGVLGDRTSAAFAAVAEQPEDFWTTHSAVTDTGRTASGDRMDLDPTQRSSVWIPAGADPAIIDALGGTSSGEIASLDRRVGPGIAMAATAICMVAAVVASSAFALAARHQLRSVGLLSTLGADPPAIRAALVLQGALPGLAAGVAAVATGAIAAAVVNHWEVMEQVTSVSGARVVLSTGGAIGAVALGTFAGTLAAWQPARAASRVPVLNALGGRRPAPPADPKVPLAGVVLWGLGAIGLVVAGRLGHHSPSDGARGTLDGLQPFIYIGALATFALGGVALAPLLVTALDRLTDRLSGTGRLVGRGLSRQRASSAAAVAAVAVSLALPVGFLTAEGIDRSAPTVACFSTTGRCVIETDHDGSEIAPDESGWLGGDEGIAVVEVGGDLRSPRADELTSEALAILGPEAVRVDTVAIADGKGHYLGVIALPASFIEHLAPWASTALSAGSVIPTSSHVITEPEQLRGDADMVLRVGDDARSFPVATPPDRSYWDSSRLPEGLIISAAVLGDYAAGRPPILRLVVRPGELERSEIAKLDPDLVEGVGDHRSPTLAVIRAAPDRPDLTETSAPVPHSERAWIITNATWSDDDPPSLIERIGPLGALATLATIFSVAVLTIVLALRSYDGRDDARAALSAGAPPATISRLRALEGITISLLGAVLALPLGWLVVTAAALGTRHALLPRSAIVVWPGWPAIPSLLAPALVVGTLWMVVPAFASRLRARRAGSSDLVVPRW